VKTPDRLFSIARWLACIAVVLCVWLIYELVNDPYENAQPPVPADRGDGTAVVDVAESPTPLDYQRIQNDIKSTQRLWEPLVKKPKPPPKKASLEQKIKGLKVVAAISEGDQVKFIIRDTTNNTEKVYKKGDKVRDLTLSSFGYTHIVLSFGGETIKVPY
jgi:hypothetical protein